MCSSSGVKFILFLFRFCLFAFTEATALHSIVFRSSICMRPDRHTSFFLFLGDVALSEYICTITVFSLYGEYVVRFFLPNGGFLPCDHGLDFLHNKHMREFNQSINQCMRSDSHMQLVNN